MLHSKSGMKQMNAHARRAGFSKAVGVGGVLAGFCITEVLDEKSPQILAESPAHTEWGCRGADPRALQGVDTS